MFTANMIWYICIQGIINWSKDYTASLYLLVFFTPSTNSVEFALTELVRVDNIDLPLL